MTIDRPLPAYDANAGEGGNLGDLPEWDLSDLYAAPDAPEIQSDLDWLQSECAAFAADYEGQLAGLDAPGMLECVRRYERIGMKSGRVLSYASLRYHQRTTDPERAKFMSDCEDRMTECTAPLVFLRNEINGIDDARLDGLLAENADLARFKPIFERIRAMRPHQLSNELERFLHDTSAVGASAWNKLFDETLAGLVFEIEGEKHSLEGALNFLSEPDRALREPAARELARVFGENLALFSRVHNTLAKEKEILDRWRKMPTPQHGRHLANEVEPEVVEALRDAVMASCPRLSHRYYEMKRGWLGLDKLEVWDRNAPLPMQQTRTVDWETAKGMVLDAFSGFDPRMAAIAEPFFARGWIDAGANPGKSPGAFAHPTVADAHPYVMLNYLGKPRDVMTLAHELGHGVHQTLAAEQGDLLSSTPLTLAETASVFGEMLTFRKLLSETDDLVERKALLAGKVEDMLNTVVRQIAFYDFECRLHDARRSGELTPDDINALWMSVQSESLGPAFNFMEGYETFWAYVPHFVHSPFYVYAYAFGDGLTNALYAAYEDGAPDFREKYFDMLKAGGTKRHKELLAPFGLDASDPKFWESGLSMISGFIDQLEDMED